MSQHKHIGRKSLSVLLAVLMMLTSMYAGLGVVAEAVTSLATTLPTARNSVLKNGEVYKVTSNISISANGTSQNGLQVAENAIVVIDIASGATLTVNGGAGSSGAAGKAGILVPESSTLIFTGGGKLVAKGGAGGRGNDGSGGGSPDGGAGGRGGYGGGAGIGGNGGNGGAGGDRKTGRDHNGNGGSGGGNGGACGYINYINWTGTVDSNHTGSTGGGGNGGGGTSGSYTNRGGGGGGGGGGGYGGYGIGGGGGAGGGGGSGASGDWGRNKDSNKGRGGAGGKDNGGAGTNSGSRNSGGSGGSHGSNGSSKGTNNTVNNNINAWKQYYSSNVWTANYATLVAETDAQLNARTTAAQNAYNKVSSYTKAFQKHFTADSFIDANANNSAYDQYLKRIENAKKVHQIQPFVDELNVLVPQTSAEYASYANYNTLPDATKAALLATLKAKYQLADGSYDLTKLNKDLSDVNTPITKIESIDPDGTILKLLVENVGGDYAGFKLASCKGYRDMLKDAADYFNLYGYKEAVDKDIADYDAALDREIASYDNAAEPLSDEEKMAQPVLEALQNRTGTNHTAIKKAEGKFYFAEVFPEGMGYVTAFKDKIDLLVAIRNAEQSYDNTYYRYFAGDPDKKIFAAYGAWSNDKLEERYDADLSKNNALKNAYAADVQKFGQTVADSIYTIHYNDQDMLLQDAVDLYLNNLKDLMIHRNDKQVEKIAEYTTDENGNFSTEINVGNYMGVKGAINQFDQTLYNFVKNKTWPIANPTVASKVQELLNKYEAYIKNPKDIKQVHNHDGNGVFTTRYAGNDQTVDGEAVGYENDIARDGADDNYLVTEAKILEVINKLENLLKSNEIGYLLDGFDQPLDKFLMKALADQLYTDKMINTFMGVLYPTLCDVFETLWASLPRTYDVGSVVGTIDISYADMRSVISGIGLATYPNQVASKMGSGFATAKNAMGSKSTWNQLKDADGNLTMNWGMDSIDFESYKKSDGTYNVEGYYNAKAARFKAALADGLKALEPVLKVLFAEGSFSTSYKGVATASKTINLGFWHPTVSLDCNLYLQADAVAGYSILVAPIFEALGITPKTRDEARNQLTNTQAIVNAIIDPISSFVTGRLANKPVNTLLEVLPNLMYALSFDKLQDLVAKIATAIHYQGKGDIYGIEIKVIDDKYDIKLGDILNVNTIIKDENDKAVPLTDVNALLQYLVGAVLPDKDIQLPVINGGKIITSATMKTGVSTRRVNGSRINFEADKADEFYVILNWLVKALGDEDFVQKLLYALMGSEPNETIMKLVKNISGDTDATLAALVEAVVPQDYDFADYTWYESDYTYGDIAGLTAADIAYIKYGNSWTKDKAQNIVDNADEYVATLMKQLKLEGSVNDILAETINGVFTNDLLTSFVKMLAGLGTAFADTETTDETTGETTTEPNKIYDIVKREVAGLDLKIWSDAFGYLFDETAVKPGEPGYRNETGVTAAVTGEGDEQTIVWSLNGNAMEDGDRAAFVDLFCAIGAGLAPIVKIIFTGEDLTALQGLITVQGYDTYKNSIAVLFEALDIDAMSAEEYKAYADANGAVAAFDKLAQQLSAWLDEMLSGDVLENLLKKLPNIVYFLESNGLATAIHNLAMPLLVVVDTIRPVLDIDLDAILSSLFSSLLNGKEVDTSNLLGILFGEGDASVGDDDTAVDVSVNDLRLSDLIKIADSVLGTDFYNSEFVKYAIPAFCAGRYSYNSVSGKTGYKVKVDAADSLTILLSGLIEALRHENEAGKTNAEILLAKIDETAGNNNATTAYNQIKALFEEQITELDDINWAFMYSAPVDINAQFKLPPQTTELLDTYLSYGNDWTKPLASYIDENLDDIVKSVLKLAGQDENKLTDLLTELINKNVYSDDVINTIIPALVKLVSGLDEKLLDLVDVLLGIDLKAYADYCTFEYDAEGNVIDVTCDHDWGIDDAENPKQAFIDAFTQALDPLKQLIAWLMLGDDYAFGTGTKKNEDGSWQYNDLITIKGSEGYAYGLVPVLEALGCKPEKADAFKKADGSYDIDKAISSLLKTLTDKLDEICEDPVNKLLELVPNLIFFLNADGLKVSLNNLVRPLNALISKVLGTESSLLSDVGGLDLTNLDTPTILAFIEEKSGLEFSEAEKDIICNFYLGKAEYFTSANGKPALRILFNDTSKEAYNGDRADMITLIVSLMVDMIKNNGANAAKLDELLKTNGLIAKAVEAIGGVVFDYEVINWNYYVDGKDNNAEDPTNVSGITEGDFTDTTGLTYLDTYEKNDWTKETAKYVDSNLEAVVNSILEKFGKEKLDELLASVDLYNDNTINAIMSFLSGALKGLDNIDDTILNLIAKVLGVDFTAILEYEGDVEYGVTDKDSFLNVLFGKLDGADLTPGILTPFERLFKFMLFGKSYEYLTSAEIKDENGEWADQITVTGGQGYNEALVPVLEALGVEAPVKSGYTSATALLKDAADAILTRIDSILHSDNMIVDVLNMLPELCYFLNADGLKVCANNLVKPVLTLVEKFNELEIENVNIDLSALTDMIDKLDVAGIAGIVEDKAGIAIPPTVIRFIETNRIGTIQSFASANNTTAYKADYTNKDHSDLITCILSAALETVKYQDNANKLAELLGTDAIGKVLDVLTAGKTVTYSAFDWDYNKNLAKSTTYIGYPNNWTESTAMYVDANLGEFADMLAQAMKDENGNAYDSFNAMINDKIALYNDETVNTIAAALKNVAQKIDDALVNAVGVDTAKLIYNIIGVDLTSTLAYVENTTYGVTDKASFVNAVKTLIAPFNRVLSFLLLDEGYKFFVYAGDAGEKDDDIIVVNGAEGYKKGLIPLMEAIGCEVKAADYDSADALMNDVLTSICDKVDELLAKPLDEILDMLPNLIYFINADGLTVSVNNTIAAISTLYTDVLAAIGKEGNLDELLGFTLSDLSFDTIFALVKDKTDIDLAKPIGEYLTTFNFGDTVAFDSKNGETAYKMTYNSEDERHDMLTIVASLLLEVLDERSNETAFRKLIGDDAYQVVYNLLNMKEVEAKMHKINWKYADKADTGEVIEPLDTTKSFNPYGPLFTREKAQYMADHFQEFIDNLIQLLGIEGKDGKFINSLEDLLKDVVGNSLYTTSNLEKIYGYIDGALQKVNDLKGSKHIKQVLKESEIADLTAYDGYKVASISDGDRAAFTAEIIRMVQPLYPVLKWLLTDEDLAFFTDKKDADQVVLIGAEGYKYGIVPVLEALLCTKVNNKTASFSSTIMDQAAYKAAVEANDDALLTAILNPVFDKLDKVMADPANELFNLIPNVQYFINSNALDTCFKNILNAVYTLTNALEPLTGKIDIMDVLGINLNELTMSSIVNALVSNIGTDDIKLDGMNFDKLLQCFNGYLYSYTNSKSGENPAYYMAYAGEAAKADTLAVILQMLVQWIASGDNPAKLKQIVREKISMSDEGYAYIDKLIDICATYAKTPSGTDSLLHVIYYIFYGVYNGTAPVANWQKDYNTRLELLQKDFDKCSSRDKNLGKVAELLDFLFVEYAGGDKDDTGSVYHNYPGSEYGNNDKPGFAANGFISFFQQIINWIKMIVNKLFHR